MKKTSLKKIVVYLAGTLTGGALAIGAQSFADSGNNALPVQDIRTFAEVYGQIKASYYKETQDDKLVQDAIKGMVSGLDPHSEYMNVSDFKDMKEHTSGEFGGLGMEISKKDDFIVIVSPIEDTPAERAGIQSGDYIVKINDESARGMSTTEAVKKMRGKPGTKITLTLTRTNSPQPIVVNLTRAVIKVKSVRSKLLEPGLGYVRLTQFQERTMEDLVKNIQDLRRQNNQPLTGLVLDLRDDPGGLLNQAVGVSAAFLPPDQVVVSTKGRSGRNAVEFKSNPADYLPGLKIANPLNGLPEEIKHIPVVVLINSGSASASEIVTGALQDHRRAVIVGVPSFGKGSVQSVIPLSNGSGVKITTALYYTPNNHSIQAQGIVPDVEVKNEADVFEMREADLGGHLDNPLGGKEVKGTIGNVQKSAQKPDAELRNKTDEERFQEMLQRREPNPEKDPQLKKAVELLKNPAEYSRSMGKAAAEGRNPKAQKDAE